MERIRTLVRDGVERFANHPYRQHIVGASSIALLLLAYTVLSYRVHIENPTNTTIPTWSQLWDGIVKIVEVNAIEGHRWIAEDAWATGQRFLLGLGVGALVAAVLGITMGAFWFVGDFFLPPLTLFSKIPPTAAMAVFFVISDIGLGLYVLIIAFGVVPTMALAIAQAVHDVHREMLDKARTLGASRLEVVWNVITRQVTPQILIAFLLQIGPAMVFLIPAEMLVGGEGFGYRIRLLGRRQEMNVVYSYLAILAASGFLMDYATRQCLAILAPWYGGTSLSGPIAAIVRWIRKWCMPTAHPEGASHA